MLNAILYSVSTIALLWGLSGSFESMLSERILILSGILVPLTAWVVKKFQYGQWKRFPTDKKTLVSTVLVLLVPAIVFVEVFSDLSSGMQSYFSASDWLSILLYSLLVVPSMEILYRFHLQPPWGLSGTAFLEALSFGVALQDPVFFAFHYASALVCGYHRKQQNLSLSFWTRLIFHLFMALYLKLR